MLVPLYLSLSLSLYIYIYVAVSAYSILFATFLSSGGNTQQSTNYTATYHPSRKLSKLDEPDTHDTAGEAKTSS